MVTLKLQLPQLSNRALPFYCIRTYVCSANAYPGAFENGCSLPDLPAAQVDGRNGHTTLNLL